MLDFGTAKGQMSEAMLSLTDQSITGYTPFYAPLEQVLRVDTNSYLLLQSLDTPHLERFVQNKTDARSDIYGLGATLYHLLTGFSPERATATVRAHFLWSGKADSLPDCRTVNAEIPDRLAEIVHKCLEIDPADRFQTATEARAALNDWHSVASAETGNPVVSFTGDAPPETRMPTGAFASNTPNQTEPIINFDTPKTAASAPVQITFDAAAPPRAKQNWGWYVGVPFLIMVVMILGGWFAWRGSGADSKTAPVVKAEKEQAVQPTAPVKTARRLTYSLLVQKMRGGGKFQEPFESSGQEIYESGYQFQLRLMPPEDGFLYVFNEGLSKNNEKYFSVIFPTPNQNAGKTDVKGGEQYQSGTNKFGGTPGTENFWIVWSKEKSAAAEQAIQNAFDNIGKVPDEELGRVADANLIFSLREYLEKGKAVKPIIGKDTEKKLSTIDFEGDAISYLLNLEHR